MRYIAKQDGYLSDTCMYIKAGQVVDFGSKTPDLGQSSWLVPETEYEEVSLLPTVGAKPVVSESKPKAHEFPVADANYEEQLSHIKAHEDLTDGITVSDRNVPPAVQPITVPSAYSQEPAPNAGAAPSIGITQTTTPAEQAANATSTSTGTGNQEVI